MSKKKENSEKTSKPRRLCKCRNIFTFRGLLWLSFTAFTSYSGYKIYNKLKPPPLPQLDLDYWWGPYPIDSKPDTSVRPFHIEFNDVMINDLRERILHQHPFVPPLEDTGFQYGFNTNFLTKVLDFWKNKYDFKEREMFLNKYEHYVTKIQGLDIHFMHIKPKVTENVVVVPILLIHGWPSSVRDFYGIIPKLTTKRSDYNFVFEVIAPSLPGFGFSQSAARSGLGLAETAVIFRNLMKRLGHNKYYVHGGDLGHTVASNMATLFSDNVLGFHSSMPYTLNCFGPLLTFIGSFWPSLVADPGFESRMYPWSDRFMMLLEESGYMHLQATKPDTVGIALSDSPAGLAAYILEKISTWTNPEYKKAGDGNLLAKYTLTSLLDNVMIYWASNSITTSLRMYAETFNKKQFAYRLEDIPTKVPTWGIKFKHEMLYQPDLILKLKYNNYLHSTVVEDFGHFAALESPEELAGDLFKAIKTFREFHRNNQTDETTENTEEPKTIYDFTVTDINGREVKLDKYRGHVLIIVNVASQCRLTDTNYKQLNELYEKYAQNKGLRILAFPCNQFNSQEPGSARNILTFTKNKGVKFDLFDKVEVNGEDADPLWQFLKKSQPGTLGNFIKWNFSKFIIDRNGVPVERLSPTTNPIDLEPILAKYW